MTIREDKGARRFLDEKALNALKDQDKGSFSKDQNLGPEAILANYR